MGSAEAARQFLYGPEGVFGADELLNAAAVFMGFAATPFDELRATRKAVRLRKHLNAAWQALDDLPPRFRETNFQKGILDEVRRGLREGLFWLGDEPPPLLVAHELPREQRDEGDRFLRGLTRRGLRVRFLVVLFHACPSAMYLDPLMLAATALGVGLRAEAPTVSNAETTKRLGVWSKAKKDAVKLYSGSAWKRSRDRIAKSARDQKAADAEREKQFGSRTYEQRGGVWVELTELRRLPSNPTAQRILEPES